MTQQMPHKRDAFYSLFNLGHRVRVYFDVDVLGVVIPSHLRKDAFLAFDYGKNLPVPTHPVATERGIGCQLMFNGSALYTYVVWDAVFAIGDMDTERVWSWRLPGAARKQAGEELNRAFASKSERAPAPKSNVIHVDFQARGRRGPFAS